MELKSLAPAPDNSHLLIHLVHVALDANLLRNSAEPFQVTAGSSLGKLAVIPFPEEPNSEAALRHTHINISDGEQFVSLDPDKYLPYKDSVAPQVLDAYFLDEQTMRHDQLPPPGKADVVIEVFDTDDDSERNFEVDAISYTITDQNGRVIASSQSCQFEDLFSAFGEDTLDLALGLIDFGAASAQIDDAWPGSDIGNRARTFRYALTQFSAKAGKCILETDDLGFIEVEESMDYLTIAGTTRDGNGHETDFEFRRYRKSQ